MSLHTFPGRFPTRIRTLRVQPRRRLARLLPALALALVVDAALVALVAGVPWWLVALVVVALAVGGLALEVRAAGDGAQQASAWDGLDLPAETMDARDSSTVTAVDVAKVKEMYR